ncbi:hypothetical protein [Ranid herpesvirus 3]|uniref:Major capsid protein n=1 Tax=Ranid herpesvirus 3 TaxID=1987509 RepID=A0A1X9T5D5_9VIRU|nr:hypothetical protein [Ranid herpesvirus 3]ARR28910.1 hypothetical protein [Ranid herpesvirus 3]
MTNVFMYSNSRGRKVDTRGLQNTNPPGRNIDWNVLNDATFLDQFRNIVAVNRLSTSDFYDYFAGPNRRGDNYVDNRNVLRMVRPDGLNINDFQTDVVVPMMMVRSLAVMTAAMQSNYNACFLLSNLLLPRKTPGPRPVFKYTASKREIRPAHAGTLREIPDRSSVTNTEMTVALKSYTNGIAVPDSSIFAKISREQAMMALEAEMVNFSEGWKACIAKLHYEYCAGQPKFSELYLANNRRNFTERGRLGCLMELIHLENTIEGCINKDPSNISPVMLAACHMIHEQGNDHIIVCPKRIVPPEAGGLIITNIPYEEKVYNYSTAGADSNDMVMDVDWSTEVVANAMKDPRINKIEPAPSQPALDDRLYATLLQENGETFMRMPAIRTGYTEPIPMILLDNVPLMKNGPCMAQPLMRNCTKRLFYTVGAVPNSYTQYKNKSFYSNNSVLKYSDVASKCPSSTFIVNYDEKGTPKEVTLSMLHKSANTERLFLVSDFETRMRRIFDDDFMKNLGGNHTDEVSYIKNALILYHEPDSALKLEHPYCVLESSPRNMMFPIRPFPHNHAQTHSVIKPRFCMWNYPLMSAQHAEYVGVLSSIKCSVGEDADLIKFLEMCYAGFGNVSTNSVFNLVVAKAISFIGMTAPDMNRLIDQAGNGFKRDAQLLLINENKLQGQIFNTSYATGTVPITPAVPAAGAFLYDDRLVQTVTPDEDKCTQLLKYILQMVDHVVETNGKTLLVSDAYCQVVYCTVLGLLRENLSMLDSPIICSYFDFKNKLDKAIAIADLITQGQLAFMRAVESTMVDPLNMLLLPHTIPSYIHKTYDFNKKYTSYYQNMFAAVCCNQEYALRTSDNNAVFKSDACGVMRPSTNVLTRTFGSIYKDGSKAYDFSTVDGQCKARQLNNTYSAVVESYTDSFYCRASTSIAERVNEMLYRMPNALKLREVVEGAARHVENFTCAAATGTRTPTAILFPFHSASALAGQHDNVYLFNVSNFRLNMTPENIHETFKYYYDVWNRDVNNNNPLQFHSCSGPKQFRACSDNPWNGILSPTFVARRHLLQNEMGGLPFNMFLMGLHYYSGINYQNVTQKFDKKYYSGWAYACVRTMRYIGHSAVAMPRKKALQVHGMKAIKDHNPGDEARFVSSQIDMAIIPDQMGTHGCVVPNVFISDIEGVNSFFLNPKKLPPMNNSALEGTLYRKSITSDVENFTLVLDWFNGMVPETMSGSSKTCESIMPLNGRYTQMYMGADPNTNIFSEKDPMSGRYCESPTLLNHSDTALSIAETSSYLSNLMYTSNPASSFLSAASYNNIAETMADLTFGRFQFMPQNGQELLNTLFQRALATNSSVETPFTNRLGMMFADSYVIGKGGGLYLIKIQNNNYDNQQFELNPRVVGEGISPTYLFHPTSNEPFLRNLGKMSCLPFISRDLVNVRSAVDSGALAQKGEK